MAIFRPFFGSRKSHFLPFQKANFSIGNPNFWGYPQKSEKMQFSGFFQFGMVYGVSYRKPKKWGFSAGAPMYCAWVLCAIVHGPSADRFLKSGEKPHFFASGRPFFNGFWLFFQSETPFFGGSQKPRIGLSGGFRNPFSGGSQGSQIGVQTGVPGDPPEPLFWTPNWTPGNPHLGPPQSNPGGVPNRGFPEDPCMIHGFYVPRYMEPLRNPIWDPYSNPGGVPK